MTGRLPWAPATQNTPEEAVASSAEVFYGHSFASSDGILKLPSVKKRGAVESEKGKHVRIIGGSIEAIDADSTGLRFRGGSTLQEMFIEGVLVDGGGFEIDGINGGGEKGPNVVLQNILVRKTVGSSGGKHADLYQPQANVGELKVYNFTGYFYYQGIFLNMDFALGSIDLRRVNLRPEAGGPSTSVALWLPAAAESTPPVNLDEVWVEPREGRNLAQSVWPFPGTENPKGELVGAEVTTYKGTPALKFPPAANVTGYVREGVPPGGDFVTNADCGADYAPRGYVK
jgi:hypothetical protein